MAVYDRWHRDPRDGEQPCGCGTRRNPLYPSAAHKKGKRWQVRWDDPNAPKRRQPRRNFDLKVGKHPELHADAFDAKIQRDLDTNSYTDPDAAEVTLRDYGEEHRKARVHGESAASGLEGRLRNHVYEDPQQPGSGRTPKGGLSIGQHSLGLLAARPSLVAKWSASIPLADGSRKLVLGDVSAIFRAAVEDHIVGSDPTKSSTVDRPRPGVAKARPYAPAEVAGIEAQLPLHLAIAPRLGVTTAMREMEMCGLGADDIVRGKAPKVRVLRQLKRIDGELRFGPVKNRKPHDVPVPAELVDLLDRHMERHPPLTVTLPWHEPGSRLHGTMVPVRLVLSQGGLPVTGSILAGAWHRAVCAWLAPQRLGRRRGASSRGYGIHRTRHTFVSSRLRAGIDVVRVAAWIGDTVEVVTKTYAHLMPDDSEGDEAGRLASAAFLGACAPDVPSGGEGPQKRLASAPG
jgi:integrase